MRAPKARFELRIVMMHMRIVIYILQDFVPKFDCGTWPNLDIALAIIFRIVFRELFSLIYMEQCPMIWWVLYTETMSLGQKKIRSQYYDQHIFSKIRFPYYHGDYIPHYFLGLFAWICTKQCRILLRILPPILFSVGWLFLVSLVVGAHIRVHQGLPEGSEVAGEGPGAVHSCGRRGGAEDVEVIDLGGAAGDLQARGKCRRGSTAVGGWGACNCER